MGIDDLFKQFEEDELADAAELATKMKPIQYAKAHSIRPQKVYAAIRAKKLKVETCNCGSKVIDIKAADEYFGFAKENDDTETSTTSELPGTAGEGA